MAHEQDGEDEGYTIEKLNKLAAESEACDQDVVAEMKSNTLLISGQHYKRISKGLSRNLSDRGVDKSKRLRLIKNHTAKGVSDIKDILASMTPGVIPYPQNEHEASHSKAAELAKVIWDDGRQKNRFDDQIESFRNSFVTLGEVASKVYFDPTGGGLKGFEQATNEFGQPLFKDQAGQVTIEPKAKLLDQMTGMTIDGPDHELVPDEARPVFRPLIRISKIAPYDLRRPKNSISMKDAPYLIELRMESCDDLKARVKAAKGLTDEEKEERCSWITDGGKTPTKIFDGTTGSFQDSEGQCLVREFYFRQSPKFPKGHYFITVDKGILFSDPLPFGEEGEIAYPIKWEPYEFYEGSARGFSPIKKIRPCQAEINRCASSISETQLLMGSDKVVLQKGAKFSPGVTLPGMRAYHTTGEAQIVPGRSGDQYTGYLEYNVEELYRLLNIPENSNPTSQSFDPKAELFKKQSQKARFTEAAGRFARFLRSNCESYLFFAQKYADELELQKVVGNSLAVDIAEFQNIDRITFKVKLLEVGDDLESAMAKTLELDTILQYAGKDLDKDTLKMILTQYPVINKTQAFKHLNMDIKNIESDILALDRGEYRPAQKYDDHPTFIKHFSAHMRERGFQLLPEQVKGMYQKRIQEHETFVAQQAEEIKRAQSAFIPSGGALVKTDFYVNPDPTNPAKAQRAMFPTEALEWLRKQLEAQGSTQAMMQAFASQGAAAETAAMIAPESPPSIENAMPTNMPMMPNQGGF